MDDFWQYGLGSNAYDFGSSGNNFNTVGYTPSYSGSNDFNVGGSGGSGGNFNTVGYSPSYGEYGDFNVGGGGGGSGGNYGTVGGGSNAWYNVPSYSPQSYAPSFVASTGSLNFGMPSSGYGVAQNAGSTFGQATAGGGNFNAVTVGDQSAANGSFAGPTAGNAGITGGFGVNPNEMPGAQNAPQQSMLERVGSAVSDGAKAVGGALSSTGKYLQDNQWAGRLAVDALGLGLGYKNQRDAEKLGRAALAEQQQRREWEMGLQQEQAALMREQMAMQREAAGRNNQQADYWNNQSTQSANEARSLYNPQEMGVRAMATQQGNTQTALDDATRQMRNRGMSQSAIDSERRRARIGGSTGAATAYTKGLDVGRSAQQSALTSAKGLSSQYTAPQYGNIYTGAGGSSSGGPSLASLAEFSSKSGAMTTQQLQNLLNTYLRDPVGRTNTEIIDENQKRVGQ